MIRNRYNYITPSVPRHQRERKSHLKVTAPQSRHYNQKAKRIVSSQNMAKRLSKIKTFTKTYMQRHKLTDIRNHSSSTALERSVKWGDLNRFYLAKPSPLVLPWCTHLFSPREGSLTHLREHRHQTNTEMKQPRGFDSKK